MALPAVISDFFEWRWMPCVALTAGSLVFVGLALLLIPKQIDGHKSEDVSSSFDRPPSTTSAVFNSSLTPAPSLAARSFMAPRAAPNPPVPTLPPGVVAAPEPPPPSADPNAPQPEN